ncbi:MAG: methyltransferase domain-containing protein, partial [Actinobacteria bacterium]
MVPRGAPPNGLVAYLVPEWDTAEAADELRDAWTAAVDDVTETSAAPPDVPDDFSGWVSSYTGRPLPADDMTEWVARTVDLLRETAPRTVLDIGCGTGLLLMRLAPGCDRYLGIDVSQPVLDGLSARVKRAGLSNVELRHGDARTVVDLAGQAF